MKNEHERSLRFAEIALEQIRSMGQVATPRNYEICYAYAAGQDAALNKSVNTLLASNARPSDSDLEKIYESHLSNVRSTDRIDELGARIAGQIDEVMAAISDASVMTSDLGDSLKGASHNLSADIDRDQIKTVVETLVKCTYSMQHANKALEERLKLSRSEISNLQQDLDVIRAESLTDPLTGLSNRKFFDRAMEAAVKHALTTGEALSILMLDIDHFKSFNDTYGHLVGDQVLRLVGVSLRQTVREQDTIARYGGEEFAVVLPDTTLRQALTISNQIRCNLMSSELKRKSTGQILGRITVSIGVSVLRAGDDLYSVIERADNCLYAAKRAGRNRVVSEADPEYVNDVHAEVRSPELRSA